MKACKNDFFRKGLTRVMCQSFLYEILGECGMIFTGLFLRQFLHSGNGGIDLFLCIER